MSRQKMLVGAAWAGLVVLAGAPAFAGAPFRVNDYTTGHQTRPSLAVEPDGDFIVVWTSDAQDGSGSGLFAQRFDATGTRRGGELAVNQQTMGDQMDPSVAVGIAGDFIVVWQSTTGGMASSIQGRRFDDAGDAVGNDFLVNMATTAMQSEPRIARAADGRFAVAWTGAGADGDNSGIVARLFDAQAQPVGNSFVVNTETYDYQKRPDIASDPAGNFVVVWQRFDYWGNALDGQRFEASGARQGTEFTVSGQTLQHASPSVSVSPTGEFLVAWTGWNQWTTLGYEMFARPYDTNGNPGSTFLVNSYRQGDQGGGAATAGLVSHGGQDEFVMTWIGDSPRGRAVFAQRSIAQRSMQIGVRRETLISDPASPPQWFPVVGMDAAGGFVVTWQGWDDSGAGIFARVMPTP